MSDDRRRPRRDAFTLLELLVVIGILAVFIGLLLSGVQKVRAAAGRTECISRLQQLGFALHAYHDTQTQLPPGCSYLKGQSRQPFMSWHTRILPYIEQEPLWQKSLMAFRAEPFFETAPHFPICERVIKLYVCPEDPKSQVPQVYPNFKMGLTDYLGVWGTSRRHRDGVLFLDSAIRKGDVIDGTSNTLMIGERPPSPDGRFGWWYAGWGQMKDGSAEMILGLAEMNDGPYHRQCSRGPYWFGPGDLDNQCGKFHFWSPHSGGANFAFADGSVRFLRYSANDVLPALATRAGGEVAVVPD